jgi:hypothetical protein
VRRLLAFGLVMVAGCATTPLAPSTTPSLAPAAPAEQSKCSIAATQENPLVTEWPASEKANLEARLREGSVVVAYSGCSLKMLPACRVQGGYVWRRTTTSTDLVEIHDADELYAKLPLGAVGLEGELARSGRIAVQTTVSGQLELQGFDGVVPADGSCLGATHVVAAMSVGAFKLQSGGSLKGSGSVEVKVVGKVGSGSASRDQSLLRAAGDPDACKQSSDAGWHPECGSPIQVFLRPLPSTIRDRGAPGAVKVSFMGAEADRTWSVVVGDREICKTPCARWVDPNMPFAMRASAGWLQQDHRTDVPDLRAFGPGPLQVRAHPRSNGMLVGGINMVTWGGMGTLAGAALLGVGCGTGRSGMCVAGAIALPVGLALVGPGIYLIVKSGARADVVPAPPVTELAIGGSF